MVNFLDNIPSNDSHLDQLDQAIAHHRLVDALEVHRSISEAKAVKTGQEKSQTQSNQINVDHKKKQLIKELEKELLYLGLKEGQGMETRDVDQENADYRGTLNKLIKDGLEMEYTFSSQSQHIKNFHLNNIEIDLNEIPEDKLSKLIVIVKFFNSQHQQNNVNDMAEKKLSKEDEEALRKKDEEVRRRQEVLNQL